MRRTVLSVACTMAISLVLAGCWLQPGYSAGRTRHDPLEATLTATTVDEATEVWRIDMPATAYGRSAVSAPLGLRGIVYAADDSLGLVAVDAGTGDVVWGTEMYSWGPGPWSIGDPILWTSVLLVPMGREGVSGGTSLAHFNPRHGAHLGITGGGGPLALAGDTLATVIGPAQDPPPGGVRTRIEWTYWPTIETTEGRSIGDYAIVGDRVLWSQGDDAAGFSPACPPFDPTSAEPDCGPDWTTPLGDAPLGPAAVGPDSVVYADAGGTVHVLDVATGAVRWRAETGSDLSTAPAVAGDTILVATDDGRLVALPAAGCGTAHCEPVWEGDLGAPATTAPIAGGDVAYVAHQGGEIDAFDLGGCGAASCAALTTFATGSEVTGGPIIESGRLVAGLADSQVVAFGLAG